MRPMAAALFGLALAFSSAGGAVAASPEEAYGAARDAAIAHIAKLEKANGNSEKVDAADAAALADLQKRLIEIIGPVAIPGFPGPAKINLETLGSGVGFGKLDGLEFTAGNADDAPFVVVTTKTLLQAWLKRRAADLDASQRVPAAIDATLRSNSFYTFAIGSDAAFSIAADLDIAEPGADFAYAALGRWAQDIGPSTLDHVVVAVGEGGRVYLADFVAGTTVENVPACKAVWDKAEAAAEKFGAAYRASGLTDEKAFDESTAAEEKGDRDWFACVRGRARQEKFYPALLSEAQRKADRLTGK